MRKVFYSFYYKEDAQRASLVRNMGVVEGNKLLDDNEWEEVTRGGDDAIRSWIDGQLAKCDCLVVLIGANTYSRRWVRYEIEKAWSMGLGVVGVYVNRLKGFDQQQSTRGVNPLRFAKTSDGDSIAHYAETHEPTGYCSKEVYAEIRNSIEQWVDKAIQDRNFLKGFTGH
ncbi:TIR domain-containing protein [Candidatus Saccharibacteria bacterium]|nr:TIR domain-containing protein [Candidatus Saccharibacteria bacterium]